ncbi:hypothetical protein BCAH1134_C0092 (plasmid) [Bacillus cereus AH1134]|nr:hypothetical protein BCAH1134_C0092 [Bacillus cereus AH1134]
MNKEKTHDLVPLNLTLVHIKLYKHSNLKLLFFLLNFVTLSEIYISISAYEVGIKGDTI